MCTMAQISGSQMQRVEFLHCRHRLIFAVPLTAASLVLPFWSFPGQGICLSWDTAGKSLIMLDKILVLSMTFSTATPSPLQALGNRPAPYPVWQSSRNTWGQRFIVSSFWHSPDWIRCIILFINFFSQPDFSFLRINFTYLKGKVETWYSGIGS